MKTTYGIIANNKIYRVRVDEELPLRLVDMANYIVNLDERKTIKCKMVGDIVNVECDNNNWNFVQEMFTSCTREYSIPEIADDADYNLFP